MAKRTPSRRFKRLDDRKRAAILAELRADPGSSRGVLARKHGVSPTTIRNLARGAGLDVASQTPQLEAATAARQLLARDLRAKLTMKLLEDAESLRNLRWAPAVMTAFNPKANNGQGAWVTETLALPAAKDVQAVSIAMGVSIDKSLQLEKHDAGGPTAAKAAVVNLVDILHAEADEKPARGKRSPGTKATRPARPGRTRPPAGADG